MVAPPDPLLEVADGPALDSDGQSLLEPSHLEHLFARGRVRAAMSFFGPAFVAAVAYVDPGNFATNIQAGAKFGYELMWVVLGANLIAMLVQYLSAKLAVATDRSLPEMCRDRLPRWGTVGLWLQAEVMAMATDVAEFLGAAIGLNLLFGVPLFIAGLLTGVIAFVILGLQQRGFRQFELAITALLGIVFLGFFYETLKLGPSAHDSLGGLIPHLGNGEAAYLAVGIVGATVMPHVIYLHSALIKDRVPTRDDGERRRVLRYERLDVIIALTVAGLVNMAMLAVAAKLLHVPGLTGVSTIQAAHHQLGDAVGGGAALAFAVALFASGASSSSVGTYAGQIVMAGFLNIQIQVLIRRLVTMLPALIILAIGVNTTGALVLSQVVLSFGIPFALIPLVVFTSRRDVMGSHANGLALRGISYLVAGAITAMNLFLIVQQLA